MTLSPNLPAHLVTLAAAVAGGYVFALLHVPLAWMIGAMFGTAAVAWFRPMGLNPAVHQAARPAALIVIGLAFGQTFSGPVLAALLGAVPVILMAGVLSQLMSGSATALVIIPIAVLAAAEVGVSPRTALVTVWVATAAAFLTPIASGANMMVQGPAGYRFGDYARLGLPLFGYFFLVATLIVPLLFPLR